MNSPVPPPRDGAPRVGIDVGRFTVKVAHSAAAEGQDSTESESSAPRPTIHTVPAAIGIPRPGAGPDGYSCIGERALARRDHLELLSPLGPQAAAASGAPDEDDLMRRFGQRLRAEFQRRKDPLARGVIACSQNAPKAERELLQVLGAEILDRFVLVDDLFLVAIALGTRDVIQHSVLIDIGHSSIRAALFHGSAPEAHERVAVPFGTDRIRAVLRERLSLRYPQLHLTAPTLDAIWVALATLEPAARSSRLTVRYRGSKNTLDVTDIVAETSACVLPPIVEAARTALALAPSDDVEIFQRNVVLVGGGAALPGLAYRLERDLRADGFESVAVHAPEDPASLAARGAWRWSHALREDDWSIPLFRFAG